MTSNESKSWVIRRSDLAHWSAVTGKDLGNATALLNEIERTASDAERQKHTQRREATHARWLDDQAKQRSGLKGSN